MATNRWSGNQVSEYDIGLATFERIRDEFPALTTKLDFHPEHVDLAMDMSVQPGLPFDVSLNLQNDELHLHAGALWIEWFPCTNPSRVEQYVEAVSGLLSGRFRILEHWRGRRPVKAQLQRPYQASWKTIATWSVLLSIPWPRKTFKVVQNSVDGEHRNS
jgi:hypothetical protein